MPGSRLNQPLQVIKHQVRSLHTQAGDPVVVVNINRPVILHCAQRLPERAFQERREVAIVLSIAGDEQIIGVYISDLSNVISTAKVS